MRVSGGVMQGSRVKSVPPVYPAGARSRRVAGTVVLESVVGLDGRVHAPRIIATPDPDLALAAITSVEQWTYKPYLLNGVAVPVLTTITVNFDLR